MALASITPRAPVAKPKLQAEASRFDRRLEEILQHAADVFYEKGYEGASMRETMESMLDAERAAGLRRLADDRIDLS